MNKEKKCLILMAVYNGERYLEKQLESIINQSYDKFTLLIRDDGSNDLTKTIINKYQNKDSRICVIENSTNDRGAYNNFFYLLEYAKSELERYDYYFLADQDDIWSLSKIETMLNFAEQHNSDEPLLVYSDMSIIDENDKLLIDSINKQIGIEINNTDISPMFSNYYFWGCDLMLTASLFFKIPFDTEIDRKKDMPHDAFIGRITLLIGRVVYLDEVTIFQRRHSRNTSGSYNFELPVNVVMNKIINLKQYHITYARVFRQTLQIIEICRTHGYNSQRLNDIENIILSGGICALISLRKNNVYRLQLLRTIGIYYVILCKKYKKYL